jgi:MFS transporter, DHA3 family, macrolide efflux protein
VLRNRTLILLWSGGTISSIGDTFFNLAVMWVIYTSSHSLLQTSFVQVVWQLDRILFGTIAGVFADRWNRKRIMVVVNVLQALVVGALAAQMGVTGHVSRIAVFVTVFVLNALNTFFLPSSNAVLPEIVGRDALVTAQGLMSTASTVANFIGQTLAGVVVATIGAVWAVGCNAISFLFPAVCIAVAKFPNTNRPSHKTNKRPSFIREIVDGWKMISGLPVVKNMVWLGVLVNVASFAGPLIPGIVNLHLHSGAGIFGAIGSAEVVGGALGGLAAGFVERKLGAGRVFILGWAISGAATVGLALATWVPLAILMGAIWSFGLSIGGVAMGAVIQVLVPEQFRGRVWGITSSMAASLIPISSVIGGWLADKFGPVPLVSVAGLWVMGTALLAWCNSHVRTARIDPSNSGQI